MPKWFLVYFLGMFLCGEASAAEIEYEISGRLAEGGVFSGTFVLDTQAFDDADSDTDGFFALREVDVTLSDTDLFFSGPSTSRQGTATEGELGQSSITGNQSLGFLFNSDDMISNVFTQTLFGPFNGDPNIAQPIGPVITDLGYFDGAGSSLVVELSLTVIPEPASVIFVVGGMLGVGRRRYEKRAHSLA